MTSDDTEVQTVLGNVLSQPAMLRQLYSEKDDIVRPLQDICERGKPSHVMVLGSGTSHNAAVVTAAYLSRIAGVHSSAPYPTEFLHYGSGTEQGSPIPPDALCIGISQSGTSISTCEAMAQARSMGFRTLSLTATPDSTITTISDAVVRLLVGVELTGPETKGYTASVMTAYLWALDLAHHFQAITERAYHQALEEAERFTSTFESVITHSQQWYENNRANLLHSSRINIVGYGIDYGTVLEGVLKVSEMLRVPTIGNLMEEYVHGPTMALKEDHAIILVGCEDAEFSRMIQIRNELRYYAPGTHIITSRQFDSATEGDLVFPGDFDRFLAPIAHTVPLHLLAARGGEDVFIDTNVNPVPVHLGHYRRASV